MNRLRVLVLGPDCDPEQVSMPYVTFSHAAALAQLHDVTLAVRAPREEPVRRAKAPFSSIEVIRMPWLDRLYAWSLRRIFKYDFNNQALTASLYPLYLAFEWRAWQAVAASDCRGRVRCRSAYLPYECGVPESFRVLPAEGTYTLRDRAA